MITKRRYNRNSSNRYSMKGGWKGLFKKLGKSKKPKLDKLMIAAPVKGTGKFMDPQISKVKVSTGGIKGRFGKTRTTGYYDKKIADKQAAYMKKGNIGKMSNKFKGANAKRHALIQKNMAKGNFKGAQKAQAKLTKMQGKQNQQMFAARKKRLEQFEAKNKKLIAKKDLIHKKAQMKKDYQLMSKGVKGKQAKKVLAQQRQTMKKAMKTKDINKIKKLEETTQQQKDKLDSIRKIKEKQAELRKAGTKGRFGMTRYKSKYDKAQMKELRSMKKGVASGKVKAGDVDTKMNVAQDRQKTLENISKRKAEIRTKGRFRRKSSSERETLKQLKTQKAQVKGAKSSKDITAADAKSSAIVSKKKEYDTAKKDLMEKAKRGEKVTQADITRVGNLKAATKAPKIAKPGTTPTTAPKPTDAPPPLPNAAKPPHTPPPPPPAAKPPPQMKPGPVKGYHSRPKPNTTPTTTPTSGAPPPPPL